MSEFFLATREDGHLFFADRPASPGETLQALLAPEPFRSPGLLAAESAPLALAAPNVKWPCALWKVTGEPVDQRGDGLWRFDQLTVAEGVDPLLALGGNGAAVYWFLTALDGLRADRLKVARTVEEEWFDAHEDADDQDSPLYQAYLRAAELLDERKLRAAFGRVSSYAERLADNATSHLFEPRFLRRSRDSNPYHELQSGMKGLVHQTIAALLVSDRLAAADFELLVSDWERFTGVRIKQDEPGWISAGHVTGSYVR